MTDDSTIENELLGCPTVGYCHVIFSIFFGTFLPPALIQLTYGVSRGFFHENENNSPVFAALSLRCGVCSDCAGPYPASSNEAGEVYCEKGHISNDGQLLHSGT